LGPIPNTQYPKPHTQNPKKINKLNFNKKNIKIN